MIHAFSFHEGSVSYANKFLRTSNYDSVVKTGKMSYVGFAQDPCKSYFKKLASLFIPASYKGERIHNANVNIARFGAHFVALTETPLPVEFDSQTLDTVGVMHYNDTYPESNIHDTAHPHYDHERKEHLGYFTQFGRKSTHNLYRIKEGLTQRELIASLEVDEPSYMHSFFLTPKYAILTLLPLVINPLDLLLKQQAFIKNFKWKPERGTKLVVIDRTKNAITGIYTTIPFFAFHAVNAFEKDNTLVMDIIMYSNSKGILAADLTQLLSDSSKLLQAQQAPVALSSDADISDVGQLTRFILDLKSEQITHKKLANERMEFPRINYDQYNGKEYTYVYAGGKINAPAYVIDKLIKVHVQTGEVLEWHEAYCYPGEPVFVAAPQVHAEDDGVVLSVVLDARKQTSFLLVLDAHTFKEIARAEVPHHIPFGIHGLYAQSGK